jgi:hypothetical protein
MICCKKMFIVCSSFAFFLFSLIIINLPLSYSLGDHLRLNSGKDDAVNDYENDDPIKRFFKDLRNTNWILPIGVQIPKSRIMYQNVFFCEKDKKPAPIRCVRQTWTPISIRPRIFSDPKGIRSAIFTFTLPQSNNYELTINSGKIITMDLYSSSAKPAQEPHISIKHEVKDGQSAFLLQETVEFIDGSKILYRLYRNDFIIICLDKKETK